MKRGIIRILSLALVAVGLSVPFMACSSRPSRDLSLTTDPAPKLTDEAERLARLQMIRVYDVTPVDGSAPGWTEMDAGQVATRIYSSCVPLCDSSSACGWPACKAKQALCTAHLLADAAGLRPTPLRIQSIYFDGVNDHPSDIRISQQSAAGSAALLRSALYELRDVGFEAEYGLTPPYGRCFDDTPSNFAAQGADLVGSLSEAYYLYRELTEKASAAIVNYADFQSSHPSVVVAQDRQVYGDSLSRAEAAHLWVGGDPGLSSTFKFCTSPELNGGARTALDTLRQAGIPPADLLNTAVSTNTLLETGTSNGASVKARLAKFWDNTNINAMGAAPLADQLSLSTADFEAARTYMSQEFNAFSRSQTVPLVVDSGTGGANKTRWAGTSSEPTALPASYYGAIAGVQAYGEDTKYAQTTMYGANGYAEFVDGAGDLIARVNTATFPDEATKNAVLDPLNYLMTDVSRERLARWTMFPGGRVYVEGFSGSDGLWVLIGDDAARCATGGSVEGGACTMVKFDTTTTTYPTTWNPAELWAVQMTSYWSPELGFSVSTGLQGFVAFDTVPAGAHLYLAQSVSGTPGTFKLLSGMTAAPSITVTNSVVPYAEAQVAKIIAPSTKWCTHPTVSCADTTFDERLPLENELAQDNDGVESSWKHYLTLARTAATQADQLADSYIQAGLEQDLRGEANEIREKANDVQMMDALNDLQSICGTDIDPAALMNVFKDLTLMHSSGAGAWCSVDSDCTSGKKCFGAQCIPDPIAAAASILPTDQYNRLARCLDTANTLPFVTVGDVPVCIWQNTLDSNDICSGYTSSFKAADHPCPDYAVNDSPKDTPAHWICSKMTAPPNVTRTDPITGVTTVLAHYVVAPVVDKMLGYFRPSEFLPGKIGDKTTCDDVRRLRKLIDTGTIDQDSAANYFGGVKASEMFHPSVLSQVARRIGWVPHLSGYSAITVDGEERWRTGDAWRGSEEYKWPCNSGAKPGMCAATTTEPGGTGLFCSTIDCDASTNANARTDITKMNERMYRAVAAARLMALDGDPTGVVRPFWLGTKEGSGNFPWTIGATRLRAGYTVPVTIFNFSGDGSNYVGYQINSATPADTLAWWSSNYSWQKSALLSNNISVSLGLTDEAGLREWSADGPGGTAVWGEQIEVKLPTARQTKNTAWWDGLSSANELGVATYAGYFRDVLSGVRNAVDVRVDRLDPHSFDYQCSCVDDGHSHDVVAQTRTYAPNAAKQVRPFDFEPESLLDGMELLCDVEAGTTQSCDATKAPTIRNADDLASARDYLACVAGTITQQGGRTVLAKLPAAAFDALRKESGVGAFPANGGDLGTKISGLRAAMVGIAEVEPKLGGEVRGLGYDLDSLRISLVRAGIKDQMSDIQFMATASAQIANCASGIASSATSFGMSGITTCTGALAQINFASQLNELAKQDSAFEREATINNFAQVFSTRAQNLDRYSKELSEHLEAIDANLSDLEETKDKARRALAKAIYMNSSAASNTMNINDAYRSRYNTANLRYQAAFKNARKLAFVAKRAIEQRLGVRLASMTETLPLVEAPQTWEQSICTAQPVDYSKVRSDGSADSSNSPTGSTGQSNYADTYIGDYVTRLENLVESYRLAYDFHEGTDTAVISLRDDVQHVRAACDTAVDNLLTYSGQLNHPSSTDVAGWDHLGCTTTTTDDVPTELPACIDVYPTGDPIVLPVSREAGVPMVYQMTFGNGTPTCSTPSCGWVAESALAQKVRLLAGKYILSWYAEPAVAEAAGAPGFVSIRDGAGNALTNASPQNEGAVAAGQLKRYYTIFTVPTDQDATLQIRAPGSARSIKVGAFQLERSPVKTPTAARGYVETTGTRTRVLKTCEDTTGTEFRATRWQRACVNLCPDGFNSQCDASQATPYCYRETTFSINQRDIDGGKLLVSSGFARGNFNYRVDNIGVNFVGTGLRDCANSTTPTTCSGAGFIPYSLYHSGPYYVRNHTGDDVKVELFNGRIEHARGLGAERFITNPPSSSDRDLLSTYMRQEFQGRPLDGNFTVRVWDEPGVNFDAIQDVQLVLNYRYWTRFD